MDNVGVRCLVATPSGCRVVATPPVLGHAHLATPTALGPSLVWPRDDWVDDMYGNKFLEMIGYIMGCSCFSKGRNHFN